MKRLITILGFALVASALTAQSSPEIFINEFLASNVSVNADMVDFDDYSDWLELYNAENFDVNIGGYYLTDDPDNPFRWQFPEETILPAGGFLRIWADGMNAIPGETHKRPWLNSENGPIWFTTDYYHLSFSLSRAGEFIGLYMPDGTVVDTIRYDLQYRDVSMGRQPDGAPDWYYFGEPTPDSSNTTTALSEPVFSDTPEIIPESGFYTGSITVTMEDPSPGDTIRYTTDGSKPGSPDPGYSDPLSLDETTVFRARLFEEGKLPGSIPFRSYFFSEDISLPVISIITPPPALWDDFSGIYDNRLKGREIPISFEYFDTTGKSVVRMPAGLRLSGQASLFYPQISFTLEARDRYGSDEFSAQFFPDRRIASFNSLYLRNGGFPDNRDTYFRDALQAMLVINKIDLDLLAYNPSVVFLNDEYWGIYNIREKVNGDYLAALHPVNPDNIDLLEYNRRGPVPDSMEGTTEEYMKLYDYVSETDLSVEENYRVIENRIDMEEFINYEICEIYYDNMFWPDQNVRMWRERKQGAKWRWIFFDSDNSFGLQPNPFSGGYTNNTLAYAASASGSPPAWSNLLFRKLLENEEFRTRFLQRFDAYLNSCFHPDTAVALINACQQRISPEMTRHINRWRNEDTYFTPPLPDYGVWLDKVEIMRNFARNRPAYQRQHLITYFGLSGNTVLKLNITDPGKGKVRINDATTIMDELSGTFFRDVPVDLYAIPEVSYRFAGWEGDAVDTLNHLSLLLSTDTFHLTARFEAIDIPVLPDTISQDTVLSDSLSPWYASGDIIVDSNVTLTLEEGVELLMPEEACILVYGKLQVNGTEQDPVFITPNEYSDSWGALCFINCTDSSLIRNLVIRGATRGHDFVRDKAAISAYNADLSLEKVSIEDSEEPIFIQEGKVMIKGCVLKTRIPGDLINVKRAESVTVEDCDLLGGDFYDSDAIDFDALSNGIVRGNRIRNFYGFNSDAVDLGEGSHNILIENNTIANICDKGISIGKGSDAIIHRNILANCGQGIGVKDFDSYAYATQNTFYGNEFAIASFVKNIGEGGGDIDAVNSIFSNSRLSPVWVDEQSVADIRYSLSNTTIPEGLYNTEGDPDFLNEFRLSEASPAINAGDPVLPLDPDGSVADLGALPLDPEDQMNVLINEIHYHPAEGDNYQFVELVNAGTSAVSLTNYRLEGNINFVFPETTMDPGEFIVICRDQSVYSGEDFRVFQWNEGNLQHFPGVLRLSDDLGFTVDQVDYHKEYWWPAEPDGQGPSLELHSPTLENMVTSSWRKSYTPGGTPGKSNNSLKIEGIFINEFLASNSGNLADEYGEYDDWIELYNSTDGSIDLGGCYLTDNLGNPIKYQIPTNDAAATSIPAKGFLLFWADRQSEQGPMHLNFVLDRLGEQIGLAQLYEENIRYIDSLSYALQETDISRGRYPDGTQDWMTFTVPTPLQSNQVVALPDNPVQPLSQVTLTNYPNPFSSETMIAFDLPEAENVRLSIYDFSGRKIQVLLDGEILPGTHTISWNASNYQPGVYFCELRTGQYREICKMVLLK